MTRNEGGMYRPLVAIVAGQIALQGSKAGVRVAAPLLVLKLGYSMWSVGMMLALFTLAPVISASHSGRLADRYGYHRPMFTAVAIAVAGVACALASVWFTAATLVLICIAAALLGAGSNAGLIAGQRSAGRIASNESERIQVFGWLGLAPALANASGSMLAGLLIDFAGFGYAFLVLALMPLVALVTARFVPAEAALPSSLSAKKKGIAWDLLAMPGMLVLIFINWVAVTSWDVQGLVLPILGHERGLSASTIGVVLGLCPLAMAASRFVIPLLASRMDGRRMLRWSMACAALSLAIYPLLQSSWQMGVCALVLGASIGIVQPVILSKLHEVVPHDRHGEALALRSMTLNLSSAAMPLVLAGLGTTIGAGALFWALCGTAAVGGWAARRL